MSRGEDLIALARSKAGQWYYTNDDWARLHPEESGGTDCSGFVRWCYLQFGVDVGTWTGNESYAGCEIARGHYPGEIPWDEMQPGDLILMTATYWDDYSFSHYLCHIELYCGGGTMIGHPSGYGPQEKDALAWMQSYGCITWMVRRVFDDGDDDMTPEDLLNKLIATAESGNVPYWELVSWAYTYSKKTNEKIDEINAQLVAMSATMETLAAKAGADPYEIVTAVKKAVDAKLKTIKTPDIDLDALAGKIVALLPQSPTKKEIVDEMYRRLKA